MSILIVDDSADNRLPLQAILLKAGYPEIRTAESAGDALQQLGVNDPMAGPSSVDVILMDIMMPHMDGIEACRRIKAVGRLRDIPVIMVTSQSEGKDIDGAFTAGAADYIVKPINIVELLARVRSALSLKREMDCRKQREEDLVRLTRQLEEANQKLERLSSVDGLTEIANRRFFDSMFGQAWRYAQRQASPLSLILIDIDHFKDYNDSFGHLSGDECLKKVAEALSATLHRPADLVARYGGEEFVVLLGDTDAKGAAVVAELLRVRVEALRMPQAPAADRPHVTISLGVATVVPHPALGAQQLIAAADRALYQAKRDGRNRLRTAADFHPPADGIIRHQGRAVGIGPHVVPNLPPPLSRDC
jgi:diguanylate cyclase (GGDEF)-like protein